MADYCYLSLCPFSCKSQKHIADSKTNTDFLLGNKVLQMLPLTYCLHLNAILDSSKLQILTATSGICSCRHSYSITAFEFNLFSALSGFTFHADKPLRLDIPKRRIFCHRGISNSPLARRKLHFPTCYLQYQSSSFTVRYLLASNLQIARKHLTFLHNKRNWMVS